MTRAPYSLPKNPEGFGPSGNTTAWDTTLGWRYPNPAMQALFPLEQKGSFELYELWLAGHGREDAEAHAPGTRENLVVTNGRLVLEIGKERHELGKGDAIVFAADVPHAYVNPTGDECWMNLVMSYA